MHGFRDGLCTDKQIHIIFLFLSFNTIGSTHIYAVLHLDFFKKNNILELFPYHSMEIYVFFFF